MPKWERSMKHEIQQVIEGSEAIFEEVLGEGVKPEGLNAEEVKEVDKSDSNLQQHDACPDKDVDMDDRAPTKAHLEEKSEEAASPDSIKGEKDETTSVKDETASGLEGPEPHSSDAASDSSSEQRESGGSSSDENGDDLEENA